MSEEELRLVVQSGTETEQGAMIGGVLDLQQRRVSEIMRPRVDVNALEKNCTSRELLHLVDETGHSRIPVYDDEIDRVVGVVNAKQLFRFLEQSSTPEDLDRIVLSKFIEPTYFVPETMAAWKVLEEMRRRRLHMAIVVDEHGGTAGVVTLEDILETVVGEIYDEDDEAEIELGDDVILNDDGSYDILGNANVDDLVAALALRDSEGNKPCDIMDVTTAAGFFCFHAGEIPAVDDHVIVHDHDFVVLEADERRVLRMKAVPLSSDGVLEPPGLNATVLSRTEEPVAAAVMSNNSANLRACTGAIVTPSPAFDDPNTRRALLCVLPLRRAVRVEVVELAAGEHCGCSTCRFFLVGPLDNLRPVDSATRAARFSFSGVDNHLRRRRASRSAR